MKWKNHNNKAEGVVVGDGKSMSSMSKPSHENNLNDPMPNTNNKKSLLNRLPNKRLAGLVIILAVLGAAGYGGYSYYVNHKTAKVDNPVPGQPVGPPPVAKPLESSEPSSNIQILPEGDGPDVPHEPTKSATGG